MAPIAIAEPVFNSWPIALSLVVSLLVAFSLFFVVVLCCCGGGGGKNRWDAEYISFDYRSPYFCEECAMRAWDTFYPNDPNPMQDPGWNDTKDNFVPPRAGDYDKRQHYFNHGSGATFKEPSPAATMHMKQEYQSVMQHNKNAMTQMLNAPRSPKRSQDSTSPTGGGGGGYGSPRGGGGAEPTGFKSGRNPAYGTLYDAKSDVFQKGGGKRPAGSNAMPKGGPAPTMMHGEQQMRAAQANPAYQTIWNAKSGVFDKPGGGGGAGMGSPQPSPPGGPAPNETRMAAAAKNPAYQTLYDAKSGIFDKKGGGGGAKGGGGPAPNETRMAAAAKNPAYQTLYDAKSGIFDKKGGGGGGKGGGGPGPTETRMAAAAKSPAYQTLYNAKSGVFDKKGGGGGRPPTTSNYRG